MSSDAGRRFDRFRPRRSLVLPLLVFGFPTLGAVFRQTTTSCYVDGVTRRCLAVAPAVALAATVGAVAASYLLAVATVAVLRADGPGALGERYDRFAFEPSDRTLAVLVGLLAPLVAYLLSTFVVDTPRWLDRLLSPFGSLLALPFVVAFVLGVVLELSFGGQVVLAVASLAATGLWVYLLAAWLGSLLAGVAGPSRE